MNIYDIIKKIYIFRNWEIKRDPSLSLPKTKKKAKTDKDSMKKQERYKKLKERISVCRKCKLHRGRTKVVVGSGPTDADIMIVGEAPGRDEDLQGLPFVGKAGQLLTKMLASIDIDRNKVYITNVVKCRPPGNRNPEEDEIKACSEYLDEQIDIISPKIILALGSFAIQRLTGKTRVKDARTELNEYRGIPVIATYHPAALLRNPRLKKDAYQDLLLLKTLIKKL